VAGLCSAAFWTWDFTQLESFICVSMGVDAVRFVIRNYLSGGLVSGGDATVNGAIGSIGSLFRITPAGLLFFLSYAHTLSLALSIVLFPSFLFSFLRLLSFSLVHCLTPSRAHSFSLSLSLSLSLSRARARARARALSFSLSLCTTDLGSVNWLAVPCYSGRCA